MGGARFFQNGSLQGTHTDEYSWDLCLQCPASCNETQLTLAFPGYSPTPIGRFDPDFFFFFGLFRATPKAYGNSWARDQTGAAAASLHHSHSNMGSEPPL